jgi:predicted nucleic acid-binding protein
VTVSEAEADISRLLELFHMYRDERAILDRWKEIVVQYEVQGKTAHDARLVAAMVRHGIEHLLTFNDQHFKRFTNIPVFHPANIGSLKSM